MRCTASCEREHALLARVGAEYAREGPVEARVRLALRASEGRRSRSSWSGDAARCARRPRTSCAARRSRRCPRRRARAARRRAADTPHAAASVGDRAALPLGMLRRRGEQDVRRRDRGRCRRRPRSRSTRRPRPARCSPAVYGYWSAVTSTPRARAASISGSDSRTRPQFSRPAALWCEICTGTPARSPIAIASRTESSRPAALVAHVRRVEAASRRDLAPRARRSRRSARAGPARRSARVERPTQPASTPSRTSARMRSRARRARRARSPPSTARAHRAVADQRRDVAARRLGVEAVEVARVALPVGQRPARMERRRVAARLRDAAPRPCRSCRPRRVVTPPCTLKPISGCSTTAKSSWVCTSMKPGATREPAASSDGAPPGSSVRRRSRRCGRRAPRRRPGRAGAPRPVVDGRAANHEVEQRTWRPPLSRMNHLFDRARATSGPHATRATGAGAGSADRGPRAARASSASRSAADRRRGRRPIASAADHGPPSSATPSASPSTPLPPHRARASRPACAPGTRGSRSARRRDSSPGSTNRNRRPCARVTWSSAPAVAPAPRTDGPRRAARRRAPLRADLDTGRIGEEHHGKMEGIGHLEEVRGLLRGGASRAPPRTRGWLATIATASPPSARERRQQRAAEPRLHFEHATGIGEQRQQRAPVVRPARVDWRSARGSRRATLRGASGLAVRRPAPRVRGEVAEVAPHPREGLGVVRDRIVATPLCSTCTATPPSAPAQRSPVASVTSGGPAAKSAPPSTSSTWSASGAASAPVSRRRAHHDGDDRQRGRRSRPAPADRSGVRVARERVAARARRHPRAAARAARAPDPRAARGARAWRASRARSSHRRC